MRKVGHRRPLPRKTVHSKDERAEGKKWEEEVSHGMGR